MDLHPERADLARGRAATSIVTLAVVPFSPTTSIGSVTVAALAADHEKWLPARTREKRPAFFPGTLPL